MKKRQRRPGRQHQHAEADGFQRTAIEPEADDVPAYRRHREAGGIAAQPG